MLFNHVNLITMLNDEIIPDQVVRVEGKTITEIGPAGTLSIPAVEEVVDGRGAFLIPGLADMHMHTRPDWIDGTYPVVPFNLYLANGVTTIRDCGPQAEDPTYVLRWRDEINAGERPGPTIVTAGPTIYGPVKDPEGTVRLLKDQGFDFIKLYSFLTEAEFEQTVAAAKQSGMYTAGHIPFAVGLDGILKTGMDEIAHIEELDFELIDFDRSLPLTADEWLPYIIGQAVGQFDIFSGLDAARLKARVNGGVGRLADQIAASQTPICTTMVVGNTVFQKLFNPEIFLCRPENRYFPPSFLGHFHNGEDKHQKQFKGVETVAVFKYELEKLLLASLRRAGVTLLLSTDAGSGELGVLAGYSIQRELQILVENGFTPYEALKTGTVNAANIIAKINGDGNFGMIETGRRADLVLVNENPLTDITTLKKPLGVMAAGRYYSRDALTQMTVLNSRSS